MPKIGPFSVSCCEPPNRSRVKVEVDSGSPVYEVEKPWYDPIILIYQKPSYLLESTSHDYYMNRGSIFYLFSPESLILLTFPTFPWKKDEFFIPKGEKSSGRLSFLLKYFKNPPVH